MTEYWVYDNWRRNRARVHVANCAHCNYGRGKHGGGSGENDAWIGPEYDRDEAFAKLRSLGRTESKACGNCVP